MHISLRDHIEKIVSLTDEEFAFVQRHFILQHFKKNDFLITEGNPVQHTYFVLSGLLKLIHTDAMSKEHIIAFAMEDWWESDFSAFYKGTKATMSLQCLEDTTVLGLTLEGYNNLCSGLHKMEHFLLMKANAGHIAAQQRILSFLTSNARERYEELISRYPALYQRVPKTQLASYLGVSRETLSRLSSNL